MDAQISHGGVTKSAREWMDEFGLNVHQVWKRIAVRGWSMEEAVTTPPIKAGQTKSGINWNARLIEFDGRVQSLSAWARELGMSYVSVIKRLRKYPVEIALGRARCDGGCVRVDGTEYKRPSRRPNFSADELRNGVSMKTANQRIRNGWTREEAATVFPKKRGSGNRWGHSRGNINRLRDLVALGITV